MRQLILRSVDLPSRHVLASAVVLLAASLAEAQLRIATYNTAEDARSELSTIFTAIGEIERNGIARPIDILSLQEQTTLTTTTQDIVDQLNAIYGPGVYARGTRTGASFGAGRPGVVYNTQTVELLAERVASQTSSVGGPRQTLRYQFRPFQDNGLGSNIYDESADFYLYSSHYKSSDTSADADRRDVEATQVRNNADALGEGTNLIFTGDLNLYRSSEPAYQTLLSSGAGQAFDPLNPANDFQNWNNSSTFADFHTQSPCTSSTGNCGVGGGVDSRFDFQLVSGELLDNEGFSLIANTYNAFGNNGSTFNDDINDNNTVSFPGLTSFTKSQVLNALRTATDHLPVVADYRVPAVLDVLVDSIPSTIEVNTAFQLGLTVSNDADVGTVNGADELDYSITVTGDLFGEFSGTELALGGGVDHDIFFDTFTPGLKSGVITVSTDSESAANSLVTIPVSFEVLAAGITGDFNNDGMVDAADYTLWRDGETLANEVAPFGSNTIEDYNAWVTNFGTTSASSTSIPEPSGFVGVIMLAAAAIVRREAR